MDAFELFRNWPTWQRAGAGKVLASPAWRLDAMFGDRRGVLRLVPPSDDEFLWLEVDFEGERHRLGVPDLETFAELHQVWSLRDRLPAEVRLALVELDCGTLLQMLEDVMRRQLLLVGFADEAPSAGVRQFEVTFPEDGGENVRFALDLSPSMEIDLGRVENIDLAHESIRSLAREVEAEYAELDLPEEALASLGEDDLLLVPEDTEPQWLLEVPDNGIVHVLADRTQTLTFAQLADGDVPVPPAEGFRLVAAGRTLARAERSRVGMRPAFKVTRLGEKPSP